MCLFLAGYLLSYRNISISRAVMPYVRPTVTSCHDYSIALITKSEALMTISLSVRILQKIKTES